MDGWMDGRMDGLNEGWTWTWCLTQHTSMGSDKRITPVKTAGFVFMCAYVWVRVRACVLVKVFQ